MAKGPTYRVQFRRRREFKTNYRKRARLLASGITRAVVRKTLRRTIVQFVDFDPKGDRVIVTAVSNELFKFGWNGSVATKPAAYLTGLIAGLRARNKSITHAVLDTGYHTAVKGCKIFAAVKGMLDAGIALPHSPEMLPPENSLKTDLTETTTPKIIAQLAAKPEGGNRE